MWIGDKIRFIRNFRGMTQKELGCAVGFPETSADVRIAQYESGSRTPKEDILRRIAETLQVSLTNFYSEAPGSPEDLMQTFFWLEEEEPSAMEIIPVAGDKNSPEAGKTDENLAASTNRRQCSAAICFRYGKMDLYLREWMERRNALNSGKIRREEYLNWKLNWTATD